MLKITLSLLLSLPLLNASLALAKDHSQNGKKEPTAARWFQVELILFSRTDAYQNLSSTEHWSNDISLSYSDNWLELKDSNINSKKDDSKNIDSQETSIQASPTEADALIKLPSEKRQLNAQAQTLKQDNAYQLLFHEAWMQPMLEDEYASSIIIAAGEQFGEHQILEGEIKLSVSRYLHFSSNLWLSQFEMNYGQTQQQIWPELPMPPNTLTPNLFDDEPVSIQYEHSAGNLSDSDQLNPYSQEQKNQSLYIPSRIVKITSKRRMRSKEIHYIDHPLFGIIIKIMPIKSETP